MGEKGLWISVTGIDGTGKTTICKYILKCIGNNSKHMKLPYFDWVRDMLKLSGDNLPFKDKQTDLLIFGASNRLEMYEINKALNDYKYLITQRSWLDFFPYRKVQGFSFEKCFDILQPFNFIKPDIIFYIKCDYKTAFNRIKNENGDKYETISFMKILEKEFDILFTAIKEKRFPINFPKIIVLDGKVSLQKLKQEVKKNLIKLHYCSGP
jgi:thymidylate kinase